MKNIKKIISTLLIVVLVLGAFPAVSFAGTTETPELNCCDISCCEWQSLLNAKEASVSMLKNLAGSQPSFEVKCLLDKGIFAINKAKTVKEVNLELSKYYKAIKEQQFKEFQELSFAKEFAENGLKALAGSNPSDAVKALLNEGLFAVKSAGTVSEVNAEYAKYFGKIFDQQQKEFKNLFAAKQFADKVIRLHEGQKPSLEVKALAKHFLTKVWFAKDVDTVKANLNKAVFAIDTQKTKEFVELSLAKAFTTDALKALAGCNPSDEVKALLNKALFDIMKADSVKDVNFIFGNAFAAINLQLAKEDFEAKLAAAKEAAIAELVAAAGENPSEELQKVLDDAIANVNAAKNLCEVQAALEEVLKAINDQLAKEDYAAKLAAAKADAIKQLEEAAGENPSDAVKKILADAIAKVNAATTLEEVQAALEEELAAIKAQLDKEVVVPVTGEQSDMILWITLLMNALALAVALKKREEL